MNADETKSLITKVLLMLFTSLSTALHASPDATALAAGSSDAADLLVLAYGVWSHRGMIKVPEGSRVIAPMAVLAMMLFWNPLAHAADLKPVFTKAPPVTPCTISSCTGLFIGGNVANAGGNLDVIGTGLTGLASNGVGIGGQGGYEFWNGQLYAAALVLLDYDVSLNDPGAGISDKVTYGVGARLGYSLASAFGAATTSSATPTLPQQFLQSLMTPYINVGEVRRHNQPALYSGAGVEALIATNWTLNADYFHYTFNQGGAAGTIGLPVNQTGDNEFRLSINRHFGF